MIRFIFLMCSERSGSNLITKLFDAHPEVCGPNTAHLADSILPELHRYTPFDPSSWQDLTKDVHELLQIKQAVWQRRFTLRELQNRTAEGDIAGLLRFVYGEEARAQGKTIAFIKENRIYEYGTFLAAHFSDARYLYHFRDPRDMAASWKESYAIRGGVVRAAQTWQQDQPGFLQMKASLEVNTAVDRDHRKPPQTPFARSNQLVPAASYEELVQEPEQTLNRLCSSLGLAFHPAMLEHHRLGRTELNARAAADWANLSHPIFSKSVGSFRTRLSADEIAYVEAVCYDTMTALGYERDNEPMTPVAFHELSGRMKQSEPTEKARYLKISEEEKLLRRRLKDTRTRIHRRSPTPLM